MLKPSGTSWSVRRLLASVLNEGSSGRCRRVLAQYENAYSQKERSRHGYKSHNSNFTDPTVCPDSLELVGSLHQSGIADRDCWGPQLPGSFRLLQLVAGNDLPKMLTLLPNDSSMTRSQRRYIRAAAPVIPSCEIDWLVCFVSTIPTEQSEIHIVVSNCSLGRRLAFTIPLHWSYVGQCIVVHVGTVRIEGSDRMVQPSLLWVRWRCVG
ncbi:hypothetical protein HZ326_24233 [Fusarium oxysporum f. sp. albedinis]|nr:hypothetical protein HZ326_24233 [Fusarium oxysporum f. sp. albedinis]